MPNSVGRVNSSLTLKGLIRSHLECCSAVTSAVSSHLYKLDIIQERASRIILHKSRDTHAKPLQKALKLDSLEFVDRATSSTLFNKV